MTLLFEGANYLSADFYALKLAQIILGDTNSGRLASNLVNKNHFVE